MARGAGEGQAGRLSPATAVVCVWGGVCKGGDGGRHGQDLASLDSSPETQKVRAWSREAGLNRVLFSHLGCSHPRKGCV